jgi:hypothetical protein
MGRFPGERASNSKERFYQVLDRGDRREAIYRDEFRKSDPRKIAIGKWIRKATAVSNVWLALRLAMGHPS